MNQKNEKDQTRRKIVTVAIVIVVIVALFWAANLLVANFNIVEVLKKLHGG